jgi:hypothetical protein
MRHMPAVEHVHLTDVARVLCDIPNNIEINSIAAGGERNAGHNVIGHDLQVRMAEEKAALREHFDSEQSVYLIRFNNNQGDAGCGHCELDVQICNTCLIYADKNNGCIEKNSSRTGQTILEVLGNTALLLGADPSCLARHGDSLSTKITIKNQSAYEKVPGDSSAVLEAKSSHGHGHPNPANVL